MIRTSFKFSILFILLFVLINVFFIQPETQAFPNVKDETLRIEATPVKLAAGEEALLTPTIEMPITDTSTVAVNTTSEAAPAPGAAEVGSVLGSFRATAYCLRGRTATGGGVRRGIVAADPRVLPMGSRVQLNAGAYSGSYVVTDTGGRIKGRILDIWVPSCSEAIRFGRRTVHVTVMGRGGKKAKK